VRVGLVQLETNNMGKFYENMDVLYEVIKKLDKKNLLAEFILDSIRRAKEHPTMTTSDIIKESKKKALGKS